MAWRIEVTSRAQRQLGSLPRSIQQRFAVAVEGLAQDPRTPRPGLDIRLLEGPRRTWRLRIGHYRGIYELEGECIIFLRFGHRSTVYR